MTCLYQTYGLTLASDSPLSHLTPVISQAKPDITLHLNKDARVDKEYTSSARAIHVVKSPAGQYQYGSSLLEFESHFEYHHSSIYGTTVTRFNNDGSQIWLTPAKPEATQNALRALEHPIFPFILRLHQRITLHANIIEIGSKYIAILGHSGRGKSTLSTAFWKRGNAIFSEDVAVLSYENGNVVAHSGITCPRVNINTASKLGLKPDVLHPVYDNIFGDAFDKYSVGDRHKFVKPIELSDIVVLEQRSSSQTPSIQKIEGIKALGSLLEHRTATQHLTRDQLTFEHTLITALVRDTDVYALTCPDDLSQLDACCDAIEVTIT